MKKNNILHLFLCFLLVGCNPKEDLPYYKLEGAIDNNLLQAGFVSEYSITGTLNSSEVTGTFRLFNSTTNKKNPIDPSVNLIARNISMTLNQGGSNSIANSIEYYQIEQDFVYYHGVTSTDNVDYWANEGIPLRIDFEYSVGNSTSLSYSLDEYYYAYWIDQWVWSNSDNISESIIVTKIEDISCELGKFECYKVISTKTSNAGYSEEDAWQFPGIGLIYRRVKLTGSGFTSDLTFTLVSTNIPY